MNTGPLDTKRMETKEGGAEIQLTGAALAGNFRRSMECLYLVETKAKGQISHPNVQRKKMAAVNWCANINRLPEEKRANREWHYVLLSEAAFYEWRDKNARMAEMLDFARLREQAGAAQANLL